MLRSSSQLTLAATIVVTPLIATEPAAAPNVPLRARSVEAARALINDVEPAFRPRATRLLQHHKPVVIGEIARKIGTPRSTTYEIVARLVAEASGPALTVHAVKFG